MIVPRTPRVQRVDGAAWEYHPPDPATQQEKSMTTMRAVRFHEYGSPTALVVDEVERPQAREGQVLVRVHAAGVNPVDWKLRKGLLKDYMPLELPHTGGLDLSGIVEEVGPGVTGFQKGQAVFGRGTGAYAEYALVDAATLARKPDTLSFEEAATIPVGAATAWATLVEGANIQPGQRVLIHGGAGGVGLWAVQLAHWKGAHVIATTSTDNVDFVRSLGADEVIDYKTTRFESVVSGVDAVIDTVGGELEARSWPLLKQDGVLVEVAGMASEEMAKKHTARVGAFTSQPTTAVLTEISTLIGAGTIHPEVGRVFALSEIGQAQTLSETGHGRGRIVVNVAG
jgi:NADPH:quinone reductase-like Zn-dependent oxidoreductase